MLIHARNPETSPEGIAYQWLKYAYDLRGHFIFPYYGA